MRFTTVRLERPEGTVLLHGIAVQIEHAIPKTANISTRLAPVPSTSSGSTPRGVPTIPIRRRDLLIDEINTDPETGQLARYRVSGLVETFDNDHQEALCERIIGS